MVLTRKKFLNANGEFINFEFVEKLNDVLEEEGVILERKSGNNILHF